MLVVICCCIVPAAPKWPSRLDVGATARNTGAATQATLIWSDFCRCRVKENFQHHRFPSPFLSDYGHQDGLLSQLHFWRAQIVISHHTRQLWRSDPENPELLQLRRD